MSRLEPAIPQNVGDRFDAPGLDLGGGHDAPASIHSEGSQSKIWAKWRRAAGLFLLAVTIFGWTTTNFLASVCVTMEWLGGLALIVSFLGRIRRRHLREAVFRHIH